MYAKTSCLLTVFLAASVISLERATIQEVIIEAQLTVVALFKLFLSLSELKLELKPVFREAHKKRCHPFDPCVEDLLTYCLTHEL